MDLSVTKAAIIRLEKELPRLINFEFLMYSFGPEHVIIV